MNMPGRGHYSNPKHPGAPASAQVTRAFPLTWGTSTKAPAKLDRPLLLNKSPNVVSVEKRPGWTPSCRLVTSGGQVQTPIPNRNLRPYCPQSVPEKRLPSLRDILGNWVPEHSPTYGARIRRGWVRTNNAPSGYKTERMVGNPSPLRNGSHCD